MTQEIPVRFGPSQSLSGVMHLPGAGAGIRAAVVFIAGQHGGKSGAQRLFVLAARALAGEGAASLRFDLRCGGDSVGDSRQFSYRGSVEDLEAAVEFLRARTGAARVAVVGLCFGGRVALSFLGDSRVRDVLCCSVITPPRGALGGRLAMLGEYGKRLLRVGTWRKIATRELDPPAIRRAIAGNRALAGNPLSGWAALPRGGNGQRVAFFYGTYDAAAKDGFRFYSRLLEKRAIPYSAEEIPHMHHDIFSSEARARLVVCLVEWARRAAREERRVEAPA
jgi:pimeloyl-ACP methyl ester carboxylesterase